MCRTPFAHTLWWTVLWLTTMVLADAPVASAQAVASKTPSPFRAEVNVFLDDCVNVAFAWIAIPAGKRLVIDEVTADTFEPSGQRLSLVFTTFGAAGNDRGGFEDHELMLVSRDVSDGLERSIAHQKTRVVADEAVVTPAATFHGLEIGVRLSREEFTGSAGVHVIFSGSLDDLPVRSQISLRPRAISGEIVGEPPLARARCDALVREDLRRKCDQLAESASRMRAYFRLALSTATTTWSRLQAASAG